MYALEAIDKNLCYFFFVMVLEHKHGQIREVRVIFKTMSKINVK